MTSGTAGSPDGPPQPLLGFPPPLPRWDGLVRGGANEAAVSLAGRPEAWATNALCVTGPAFAGLSYLSAAWARRFEGRYLSAAEFSSLKRARLDELAEAPVALDDADLVSERRDEALLSLINIAGAKGGRLLLVSHLSPSAWKTGSADLRSRLNALPVAEIGPPDEAHLRARLQAAANQRFMKLSPETVNYLLPRLDLSYEAIETLMERLSEAVSATGKAPGLALARSALEGLAEDSEEGGGAD